MANSSNPLRPTFEGLVASTFDSLVLFEACLSGRLNHVPRRPHDRERNDLIKSGHVFIYEEHASGIKRWTDGVSWSPSRILGNFLIYRELEKPFAPGEKKRALKRKKCPPGGIGKTDSTSHLNLAGFSSSTAMGGLAIKDTERALIGSLVDSYPFKPGGLVKKTISINYQGVPHHLVSYYNVDDAAAGVLDTPTRYHGFQGVVPRHELISTQNFRAPIDEVQYGPEDDGGHSAALFASMANTQGFSGASHGLLPRAMSLGTYHPGPVPATYGPVSYPPYNPHNQYLATMNSPMPLQIPQPLPSSLLPSMTSPAHPSVPSSISQSMPSSTAPMSYGHQPQGNYSLGPDRTPRFSSGSGMEQEFPRNLSIHDTPRRNSAYELVQHPDLTSMPLGHTPGGRPAPSGSMYTGHASYYTPQRQGPIPGQDEHAFTQPRPIKQDLDTLPGEESETHHYNLDQAPGEWTLEQTGDSNDMQYFGNGTGSTSEQWQETSNTQGSEQWQGVPNKQGSKRWQETSNKQRRS